MIIAHPQFVLSFVHILYGLYYNVLNQITTVINSPVTEGVMVDLVSLLPSLTVTEQEDSERMFSSTRTLRLRTRNADFIYC